MNIIRSALIAFSFLTILPVPRVEWNRNNLGAFTVALPLVGLVVGGSGAAFFVLLLCWQVTNTLRGTLMTFFYLFVTGGIHMDGLMDTSDAFFSRQNRDRRLEILSDTHAGAFAVMACVFLLSMKAAIFCELFDRTARIGGGSVPAPLIFLLALIPVFSRIGLGALFHVLPFAKENGLARTLGACFVPAHLLLLTCLFAFCALCAGFSEPQALVLPASALLFFFLYRRFSQTVFGGISGDLLGAFVELAELLMLATLLFLRS